MWVVLAVLSAVSFGSADFLGGLATRRTGSALSVVVATEAIGLGVALALVPLFPMEFGADTVVPGALAGVLGAVGLVFLYRGLAIGAMGVVAPVTAVGAAVVPVGYGLLSGERPSPVTLAGALVALLAIWIVTGGVGEEAVPTGVLGDGVAEAIVAGAGFGGFFILLHAANADSGLVPIAVARVSSLVVLGPVAVFMGQTMRPASGSGRLVAGSGVLDTVANALFLEAARRGLLSIAAVLSSLYPVATVLLARLVVKEHISRRRASGLALAVIGIALIGVG